MKTRMYWSYATRSLARGGQRTLLAIFCIAVGVMAIVALQLVGNSINSALTANVRAANGGDLAVFNATSEIPATNLATFSQLTTQGVLTNYTAVAKIAAQARDNKNAIHATQIWAVDPAKFPLAGAPQFISPSDGQLSTLLTGNNVVVTENTLTTLGVQVGDSVVVHSLGRAFTATIAGEINNTPLFSGDTMLMAFNGFAALPTTNPAPLGYQAVYADVPGHSDANAATAKQDILKALPLVSVTTTKDTLQQSQQSVQCIRYFLQVAGLLALLIGGIGIVNTMQVVLRRRQTEIAMLKTAGYRRGDLVLLFGVEAGVLGLLGGIVGAAVGIGVSFLVKGLMENVLTLTLPVTIDPLTVLSGVAIGFFTALIFGLLPIAQASQIRPVSVLRGLGEHSRSGIGFSLALGAVLVALFFVLALSIVQNVVVSLGVVVGGGLFLLLLTLGFTLVALIIGRLPVLDHFIWQYILVEVVALALSLLFIMVIPAFGILFLTVTLIGVLVVLLPPSAKSNVRMALRNIGRKKARSATTLVALFVGVFAIGLILTLGQNLETGISATAANYTGGYNTFINASSADKAAVDAELARISGVKKESVTALAITQPQAVNGVPIAQFLSGLNATQRQTAITDLSGVAGNNLAQGQLPTEPLVKGNQDSQIGRNLTAQDAGTNNVIVAQDFAQAPFNLKLGDTLTLAGATGQPTVTLTIVGFFQSATTFGALAHPIQGDISLVNSLTFGHPVYVYSLILAPGQADKALQTIQQAVPSVQVISLAQELNFYLGLLNNLVTMMTAVASLALLAGLIIIANAVALALLERRRELGILKSVGYTSSGILSEVLIENGSIGFVGAVLAMLLAALVAGILASTAFHVTLGTNLALILVVVVGTAAVCMLVAGLVAWKATRVRPLNVLRYE